MSTSRVRNGVFSLLIVAVALGCASAATAQDRPANAGANDARITLLQAKPRAYAVVESTQGHEQPRVRLAGIEAAQHAPDAAVNLTRAGLVDENPAVRFAALVTIGKLRLEGLADAAVDLMRDENPSVRAAAIFAAKRCGKEVDLSPLGAMLAGDDPSARANAAMLVGELGDAQAFDMLRDMAAKPMPRVSIAQRTWIRLQFAEAMARLKPDDAEVLSSLRAAMFSNLPDVRVLSIQILGEIGDRSVQGGLISVIQRDNPIQVQIAAAQALAQLGEPRGAQTLLDASAYDAEALERELKKYLRTIVANDSPEAQAINELLADEQLRDRAAAEVRAQAAAALGWLDSQAAAQRLAQLLDDPDPIVQTAAAAAVLRASR